MIQSKARYIVEHQLLKHWFFNETRQLIEYLKADEQFVGKVTQSVAVERKENATIDLSSYKCQLLSFNETHSCAILLFPTPTNVPECYIAYLLFDDAFKPCQFYTVEQGADYIFLCEWTPEMHLNHGAVEMDPQRIFHQVVERFEKSVSELGG